MKFPAWILLGLLASALALRAQNVVGTTPSAAPVSSSTSAAGSGVAASGSGLSSPFSLGSVVLHPGLTYRMTYSDGLSFQPGRRTNSYIQDFSAVINAAFGSHWTAMVGANWNLYSNKNFSDTHGTSASLNGANEYSDLGLKLTETYSDTTTVRVETGRQTSQETSVTTLGATYRLSDKASLSLGASQDLQYIGGAPDPFTWSITSAFNYRFSSKLTWGGGVDAGYNSIDPGPDMTTLKPHANLAWNPTDKLGVSLTGGRETRKLWKGGRTVTSSPSYSASINYAPATHTSLGLGATQAVSSSFFANTLSKNRGWNAELHQRLLGKLNFTAGYSNQKTSYVPTALSFTPSTTTEILTDDSGTVIGTLTSIQSIPSTSLDLRSDTVRSYHFELGLPVLKRVNLSATYQYSRNGSTNSNFSFSSKQIGFSAGIAY